MDFNLVSQIHTVINLWKVLHRKTFVTFIEIFELEIPSSGLNFLSFVQFSQTFNHVCVYLLVLLVFALSVSWLTIIIIIIIILLKFKFGRFFKFTQPAYSIANRGGLYNLQ